MAGVVITIDGWDKIVAKYGQTNADKALRSALEATADYTSARVKSRIAGSHHVTGFLLSSIRGNIATATNGRVYAEHGGGVYYATFVEHGTGIYGPQHTPIVPTHKKFMMWHPKTVTGKPSAGGKVFRRSVKGQPAVNMFHNTFTQDKTGISNKFKTTFLSKYKGN